MKKKVTIQDIADALGISRNTVSKAINNSEGLADSTREMILQKAIEMGYKQFSYVGTLAGMLPAYPTDGSVRQGEIAILSTAFLTYSHFASTLLDKFQREISQLGFTLNMHYVSEQNLENKTLPGTFQKDRVRAMLCLEMFDRSYGEMLCDLGLPVLFVDGPVKEGGFSLPADQLYMDNSTEIIRFINEMLTAGQRRFGFIGDYNHCQSFYERYCAFRLALFTAGVPVEERFCFCGNHPDTFIDQLAALEELPDVFICANDFVAGELVRSLFSIGFSVPEDVRVLGFDDAPEARLIRPALSTIHIHTQTMAFSAVHLLLTRMKVPSLDYRVVHTETNLIYRESTKLD